MRCRRFLLAIAVILCPSQLACAQTPSPSLDLHSAAEYRAIIKAAKDALPNEDTTELGRLVDTLRQFDIYETPTYEWRFFHAALLGKQGRDEDARTELAAFEDMLRIDSGVWKCDPEPDLISYEGVRKFSPVAYQQLCVEGYLGYFENPKAAALRHVAEWWSLSADLRSRVAE